MIPELGQIALSLALVLSAFLSFAALYGAHRANAAWMAYCRPATQSLALLVAFAQHAENHHADNQKDKVQDR